MSIFLGLTNKHAGTSSADVFTEADVHIQNTVIYNLKQLYPRATIIGEEDEVVDQVTAKAPYIQPDELNVNHVSRDLLLNNYVKQ